MDAIKILGDLLGNQSMARGGTAQSILKTILTGGGMPPQSTSTGTSASHTPDAPQPAAQPLAGEMAPLTDWEAPARSPAEIMRRGGGARQSTLGGLIRQAVEGYGERQRPTHAPPAARPSPARHAAPDPQSNSHAEILIRAMINAAKSDGRIDDQEQQNIIGKLGQISQDEIEFLRNEFAQPLDLNRFAQQIPRGLEVPVYTLSLTAIDLDTNREAQYLHQLAQTLGISPETCNRIHAQLGAPALYS